MGQNNFKEGRCRYGNHALKPNSRPWFKSLSFLNETICRVFKSRIYNYPLNDIHDSAFINSSKKEEKNTVLLVQHHQLLKIYTQDLHMVRPDIGIWIVTIYGKRELTCTSLWNMSLFLCNLLLLEKIHVIFFVN